MSSDSIDYNGFCIRIDKELLQWFADSEDTSNLLTLATKIMTMDGFPMHYPLHHYLVPALLLSTLRKAQGEPIERLEEELAIARERSVAILGGFCGYYGACGACVGVGIFWCIATSCSPMSSISWGYANRATGTALLKIAEIGGPRCCKRCLFLALESTIPQIREVFSIDLQKPAVLKCKFSTLNNECLKIKCPYYAG